jgi:hypothetical protein
MKLSARIYACNDRIYYSFDTEGGTHCVDLQNHPACGVVRGNADAAIECLSPYRENLDVRELIEWLSSL